MKNELTNPNHKMHLYTTIFIQIYAYFQRSKSQNLNFLFRSNIILRTFVEEK